MARTVRAQARPRPSRSPSAAPAAPRVGPAAALMASLAVGGAWAQTPPADPPAAAQATALPEVKVQATAEHDPKDSLRVNRSGIGKGDQALRDIPQSVTVITERLMDDRNLDDFREVLRATAGVTFQAGETGEEDVRLRGFSLLQAGDIYLDGRRDPGLQERDTFNLERVEVLKGSASMLFGRGSTGGVVNQVSKRPFLMNRHEVNVSAGSGEDWRVTGDFNLLTGPDAALRINTLVHQAEHWGAEIDKKGIAPTYNWGIGTANEFQVGFYHLEYDNKPLYNHPWFLIDGKIKPSLPAKNYYGLASDYNQGRSTYGSLMHIHRFGGGAELKTSLQHGRFERDLWASVVRFAGAASQPGGVAVTPDTLGPDTVLTRTGKGRVGVSDITTLQSDFSNSFQALGVRHSLIAGVEFTQEDARRNNNAAGPARPNTTVGTPNDGASIGDTRDIAMNEFDVRNISLYAQDTVELTSVLKLVGGLRFDRFKADFRDTAGNSFTMKDMLWSPRVGLLFQPNDWASFHVSYGTSYNTSADTYQHTINAALTNPANARVLNTPPEKSRNIEIGGKFDLLDNRLWVGTALFYSEKYNERNTDPDSPQDLLSGKRHALGLDLDVAGRITAQWDAFLSYTWIPSARIDRSNVTPNPAGTGAQVQGDRPGLTPKHSASLWTTYRVLPSLRVGAGLNHRGEQNPEGARHVTAASFTTLDLMAEYAFNESLSLKVNVNNATDKLYADSLYRGFYTPGAPRTVQATLKAVF
ncbi:TonB-dependent receptor [Caldimonas caldifontis]|uniref:TonB-dependent siderophore receptor n=1 Tax=Caldimonas caldifontis TaxID=1452508 RepID=A0A2S5SQN1_9BURK|nr:TonB-dependent siderophore receptor [Caldimonas caldifontis]PPE65016.1 TonB-dependent siderophore receptor [Caldimonas caldifontis]